MKKIFLFLAAFLCTAAFAENSIKDALKIFDAEQIGETRARVTIGAITYQDSDISGSISEYIEGEIRTAIEETRRLELVDSSQSGDQIQTVVATRGMNMGLVAKKKSSGDNEFVIQGSYAEKGNDVELTLTMLNKNGVKVRSVDALIPASEIIKNRLELFPGNIITAKEIEEDFANAQKETSDGAIKISASMIDANGNLVRILRPGDRVRFSVQTDRDAYIAIQGIDATGDMYWLPVEDNFIPRGQKRIFPDGDMAFQVMDGIYGAESIVIHACATKEGLDAQVVFEEGTYRKGRITATRGLKAVAGGAAKNAGAKGAANGMFKISYTVISE